MKVTNSRLCMAGEKRGQSQNSVLSNGAIFLLEVALQLTLPERGHGEPRLEEKRCLFATVFSIDEEKSHLRACNFCGQCFVREIQIKFSDFARFKVIQTRGMIAEVASKAAILLPLGEITNCTDNKSNNQRNTNNFLPHFQCELHPFFAFEHILTDFLYSRHGTHNKL